ncbi:hypothetical protein SPONN_2786 [uncultured Candidatus Thioglobus sp.]|nr:hypothetical protein SPONN_2786 [uncultured Candidatus Thioglobus sp.]
MQTVKAQYKKGKIQLLTPIQGVEEAELYIVVLDKDEQVAIPSKTYRTEGSRSESDFKSIGLANFFDGDEDRNVDWDNYFNVK